MKRCINCGKIAESNNFMVCSACGGMLAETNEIFCPNCGTQIANGWAVCPVCATPFSGGTPAQKKRTGLIVLIAVIIIALIGAIVGLSIYLNNHDTGSGGSSSGSSSSGVSSSKSGGSGEKTPMNDEEAVRATVAGFMDNNYCSQIKKPSDKYYNCKAYVLEGCSLYKELERMRDLDDDATQEQIEIYNAKAKRESYEITAVEIHGDKAIVKGTRTTVDTDDVEHLYNIDYEWLYDKYSDELSRSEFEKECAQQIHEYRLMAIKYADLETLDGKFHLEKHDGEWYIAE